MSASGSSDAQSPDLEHVVELESGEYVEIPPHARNREDPTGTKTARLRYKAQLSKRYRALRGAVNEQVVDRDYLGVKGGASPGANSREDREAANAPEIPATQPAPTIPRPANPSYQFPTDASRRKRFAEWVEQAANYVTLGNTDGVVGGNGLWTDEYIRYAYNRGVMHANASLRFQGYDVPQADVLDTFNIPIHRETVEAFYQRQYDKLRELNRTMSDQIADELSRAYLEGLGTTETANRLTSTLSTLTAKRAHAIARTEMIWAANEATLNRYQRAMGDNAGLTVVAEFSTAGDRKVCARCRSLEGEHFRVADAHNVIPQHPNCRCAWIPVTTSAQSTQATLQ